MNSKSLFVLLFAAVSCGAAQAQQYPARTVRMVVGFPPGGGTDIVTRLVAQKLTESRKQQLIVDNRPGATGMIGANIVVKLNGEVNRILQLPDVKARIDDLGVRLDPMTPEQFTEFVRRENATYEKVAKDTGIRME